MKADKATTPGRALHAEAKSASKRLYRSATGDDSAKAPWSIIDSVQGGRLR